MKILRDLCLASVLLALPGLAHADTKPAPGNMTGMNCPMMGGTAAMRQDMGAMMTDMSAMMKDTSDPAMKARMQKMHEQMAMMSANMRKMGGGMMGGMMQAKPDTATPPAKPADHADHHPK